MTRFEDRLLDELRPLVEQDLAEEAPARRPRRVLPRIALAGALTLGLLAAVVVVRDVGSRPANAAAFLEHAATVVERQADTTAPPRDDQWLYRKELSNYRSFFDFPDLSSQGETAEYETWVRGDGKERRVADKDGKPVRPLTAWAYSLEWYPATVWAHWESLPRDPAALLEEIKRDVQRDPWVASLGRDGRPIEHLRWIRYLLGEPGFQPPADLRAAMFRALALIPGIEVTEDVTDLAGRKAVLLSITSEFWEGDDDFVPPVFRETILLDPTTYEFLGTAVDLKDGKVTLGTAFLAGKIVDEPGDR